MDVSGDVSIDISVDVSADVSIDISVSADVNISAEASIDVTISADVRVNVSICVEGSISAEVSIDVTISALALMAWTSGLDFVPAPQTASTNRRETRADRRCFRCGEPGHLARDCPAPAPRARPSRPAENYGGVAQ